MYKEHIAIFRETFITKKNRQVIYIEDKWLFSNP